MSEPAREPLRDPSSSETLARIYQNRFTEKDLAFKERMWRVLCDRVFQPYVDPSDTVLDLGAGTCEFINAIRCASKIAVDLNEDVTRWARNARVVVASSTDMAAVSTG